MHLASISTKDCPVVTHAYVGLDALRVICFSSCNARRDSLVLSLIEVILDHDHSDTNTGYEHEVVRHYPLLGKVNRRPDSKSPQRTQLILSRFLNLKNAAANVCLRLNRCHTRFDMIFSLKCA